MSQYYVYIMANATRTLYVGVTNNLERRVYEHKSKQIEGFTKRYNIVWLVYFAETNDIREAIAREKQIKGWTREKKLSLVAEMNPQWHDISADWYNETSDFTRKPVQSERDNAMSKQQQPPQAQTHPTGHPCHSERSEESKNSTRHSSGHLRYFASLRMTKRDLVRNGECVVLLVAFAALLVACDTGPASVSISFPEIRYLTSISITDGWGGFSRPTSMSASYNLERSADGYTGEADFHAEDSNLLVSKTITGVVIPNSEIQAFLDTLGHAQAKDKVYDCDALRLATDDFPRLDITLRSETSYVTLYSCSQHAGFGVDAIINGGDRIPWAVEFGGKTYTIDSDDPAKAYAILNPYLKKDEFGTFVQNAVK